VEQESTVRETFVTYNVFITSLN